MLQNYHLGSKHLFVSRGSSLKISFHNMFHSHQGFEGQTVLYCSDLCTPTHLIHRPLLSETKINPYYGPVICEVFPTNQTTSSRFEDYFLDSLNYMKPKLTSWNNIQFAVDGLIEESLSQQDREFLNVIKGASLVRDSFPNYKIVPIEFLQNLKSSIFILKNRYNELEKKDTLWASYGNERLDTVDVFLDQDEQSNRMKDRYIAWYLLPVLEMILLMFVRYQYLLKVDPCNPIRIAHLSFEGMLMMYIRELKLPIREQDHPGILRALFNRLISRERNKFSFNEGRGLVFFIEMVKFYRGVYHVELIEAMKFEIRYNVFIKPAFDQLPDELVRKIGSYLHSDSSHVNYVLG